MEKKKVPALRFRGFHDDWEQRKLGELASLITKGTTPLDKSNTGVVNFVKIESIDESSGNITITQKISLDEHNGYLRRSQLKENDILFSIAGTLGRVTSVNKSILPANTNQALAIIRLKDGYLDYVKTYLKGKAVADFIKKNPTIGAQPNLSLEQVANLEIAIPSVPEQIQIGAFFKHLDHLITLHQRKYEKLQKLKKAMLEKMFPKPGCSVPEIRFQGFTDDWEQCKLGDVVEFLDTMRKPLEGAKRVPGPYPYYGASGIVDYVDGYLFDEELVLFSEDGANITDRNYPVCFLATGKYWVNNHVHVLRTKKENENNFICNALERKDYTQFNTGMAMPKLNKETCKNIPISCPVFQEQKKIGDYFRDLDHLITLHQRKLEKLKNLKKACLEKMFV